MVSCNWRNIEWYTTNTNSTENMYSKTNTKVGKYSYNSCALNMPKDLGITSKHKAESKPLTSYAIINGRTVSMNSS